MKKTRRKFIAGGAAAGAGALAGCTQLEEWLGLELTRADDEGYAAFFSLWDWAEEISGDHFSFENPVETGEMGHGWSPGGDLPANIARTAMFIYLDTPEFRWAQDLVEDLEADYPEVNVVNAMRTLGPHLIYLDDDTEFPEPDTDVDFHPDDIQTTGEIDVFDLRGEPSSDGMYWHNDHWHGDLQILKGEEVPITMVFENQDGDVLPLGLDEQGFELRGRLGDGEDENVIDIESDGDQIIITAKETGRTGLIFELHHEDQEEPVFVTTDTADAAGEDEPFTIDVSEDPEEIDNENHDPHVWVDPIHAKRMVDVIKQELQETDPDNADAYEENAEEYKKELDDIHEEFEEMVESANKDTAIFVGHDSYQYVEQRYEFDLETLTGISPDEEQSVPDEIMKVAEEHDIETVLYDPFEAGNPADGIPQEAELVMDEVDSVTNAEPLTPLEGTTREWEENGWGWVEQMRNINLESLRKALDAE
ncbi:zinc ABC transporter substrate-binding protein [Salinarchaeum sp. IM2453]|uniref:metal ABC transporter solute-binding protein, Zn/Mn family n=1 Tax=Salinarchaeum sp. IM2453 TaxID=2862870 RepID=UPI001C83C929|nr:zinc ABC transporter substrate-binding protein [Salinarchaeum sp. IM2453]QZA88593.1 zinc ABC transporter substrate-binding protein [Salinarchaeum sp. IM2453]